MSTLTVTTRQEQMAREFVAQAPEPRFTALSEEAEVEIPDALGNLIRQVLRTIAEGGSVTLKTLPQELSTTVAAAELGVSRPTLMRMIRDGEIPAHKVGTHHRLNLSDVVEFRRVQLQRQRAAFDELRQIEDDLDVE